MLKVTVREWDYDEPGAADWIFALCCTVLLVSEIKMLVATAQIQTAHSYYFATPGVLVYHRAAMALDGLVLLSMFLWLVTRWKSAVSVVPVIASGVGASVCWIELVRALDVQRNALFQLQDLPRSPMNNMGLLGAQIFMTYLVFRVPLGGLRGTPAVLIRVAMAVCLWIIQSVAWDMVVGPGAS